MHEVVVIGSGPVGATAALNLLLKGKKVLMLDIGDLSKDVSTYTHVTERLNLKLAMGETQPYDFNEFNILLGEPRKWFTSKSKGGHSLVWGATWNTNISEADTEWKDALASSTALLAHHFTDFNTLKNASTATCSCFDNILEIGKEHFQTSDFEVQKSQLAVNVTTCNLSGQCHSFCQSGSIWTSLELLKKCEQFPDFTYKRNAYVNSIVQGKNSVAIHTLNESFLAENLFLAAGPVGNALILLRSKLVDEIRLSDTQMITIPILSFSRKNKHSGKFGLAGMTINGKSLRGHSFHVQIYSHPETFQDRILNILPRPIRKFSRYLLKILMHRLFVAIVYLDSAISGELILEMKNTPVYSKLGFIRNSPEVREIRKILSRNLFKLRLVPLWNFEQVADVGESYHVGATKSFAISKYGEVDGLNRISILGSLSLHELKPGPITSLAMAQALLSTNRPQFG